MIKNKVLKVLMVKVYTSQHDKLSVVAYKRGVSKAEVIRDMLDEYLYKRKPLPVGAKAKD